MELSISNNINQSKDKEINQFIKELGEALKQSETKNKINNNIQISQEEPRDSFGFTEKDYRRVIYAENFVPTIVNELQLTDEDLEILNNKVDNYLREYSKYVGTISYNGYDMDNGQYYDDWFENGKKHRNKLTEQEFAQSYDMGEFFRITYSKDSPDSCVGSLFTEIKQAIKLSIQEQLADNVNIKDINLMKLNDSIKNNKYLKPLYEQFD